MFEAYITNTGAGALRSSEVRDKGGLETFESALVLGNHTRSVKDLINLTQNLDLYRFYPDISDDEGLGRLYADELGTIDICADRRTPPPFPGGKKGKQNRAQDSNMEEWRHIQGLLDKIRSTGMAGSAPMTRQRLKSSRRSWTGWNAPSSL